MNDANPPSKDQTIVRLMGTTPMRDWARGRLSGRLDRDRLLRDAALPAPLADLVAAVTRRTRLWRSEKVDVTRELIAHFRDGLDAGADPARLAADFGEPARAARLIRRAKRRNRPLPWRAMIYARNAFAILLLVFIGIYAILAVRFFTGRPSISRDYLAELNAPALRLAESQRAWPVYREGMFLLPPTPPDLDPVAGQFDALAQTDPRKPIYTQYLQACGPALEKFAEAAGRPALGSVLSATEDTELAAHWERLQGHPPDQQPAPAVDDGQPMLISVLLPYLGKFRWIARTAAADAQLAAQQGDAARVERDLRILIGLADHTIHHPFLIGQLTGLALHALASEQVAQQLSRYPGLLSDDQLRDLAHRLSAAGGGTLRIRFDGELVGFEDTLQHLYTDDGHGDGRLAGGSLQQVRSLLAPDWPFTDATMTVDDMLGPMVMGLSAGRAEISRLYRSYLAEAQAYAELPMWERGEPTITSRIEQLVSDPLANARYWPALLLIPALDRIPASVDLTTQRRDAALTALALELYRRRVGTYPDTLESLAPDLLPSLPPDQFDGRPIKYLLRDGSPVLYSIGADRKDDQARAPHSNAPAAFQWVSAARAQAMMQDPLTRDRIDGDWILYPPDRPEVPPPPAPSGEAQAPPAPVPE